MTPLHIIISSYYTITDDNVVAVLERNDHVCNLLLDMVPSATSSLFASRISRTGIPSVFTRSFLLAPEFRSRVDWGVRVKYIRTIHSSEVPRPSKARRPVLNLGPFL